MIIIMMIMMLIIIIIMKFISHTWKHVNKNQEEIDEKSCL